MKKILIADSIKNNSNILKRALESHGFQIIEVYLEKDLLSLNSNDVMLVLLSHHLHDKNAFDILKEIKQVNSELNRIPFIICTSRDDIEFISKSIKAGFKGVLIKPYNRKNVFELVKNILIEEKVLDKSMFIGDEETQQIQEREKLDFLKFFIKSSLQDITPVYNFEVNIGFAYPMVNEFFALEPGEGFDLLRELHSCDSLSRRLFDKINLCPTCNFHTLNFREICPKCKSLDIHIEPVYHHFACGYVGPLQDFKATLSESIICPKCDKKLRHIGLDYEKPSDTFICKDCEFTFIESDVDFHCFHCDKIGAADEVIISIIYSYQINDKTKKMVEYDSLTAYNLKDALITKSGDDYNRDFFDYMLKRKYLEHIEYNDSLTLIIIKISTPDKSILDDVNTYMSGISGSTDLKFKDPELILQIITRKDIKTIEANSKKIHSFTTRLRQLDSTDEVKSTIMIRQFKEKLHSIDTFIDESLSIFKEYLPSKKELVYIYDK